MDPRRRWNTPVIATSHFSKDAGKRVLFVAAGSDVVQLSLGAQRFIAAGQIGNEDSQSKGRCVCVCVDLLKRSKTCAIPSFLLCILHCYFFEHVHHGLPGVPTLLFV